MRVKNICDCREKSTKTKAPDRVLLFYMILIFIAFDFNYLPTPNRYTNIYLPMLYFHCNLLH